MLFTFAVAGAPLLVLGNEPDESQQTIRCPPPETAHGSEARAWLNALEEQALALGALESVTGARIRATSFELALGESVTVRCSSATASLCADLRGYCCATRADRLRGLGAHARAHRQLEVQRDEMGRELEALVKQDNKQM